jgi:hypothetical protein
MFAGPTRVEGPECPRCGSQLSEVVPGSQNAGWGPHAYRISGGDRTRVEDYQREQRRCSWCNHVYEA